MHVFWGMKKLVQLKFVQLLLLNRVKARWSKNGAPQGFYYKNSFSSNIFGPNSKTCTCKVRAAWGRVSRGLTVGGKQVRVKFAIMPSATFTFGRVINWARKPMWYMRGLNFLTLFHFLSYLAMLSRLIWRALQYETLFFSRLFIYTFSGKNYKHY